MPNELKRTLSDLVAIDSTSVLSNAPVADYLERRLEAAGFDCRRHLYRDDAGVEKVNLLAIRGGTSGDVPALALVGHTDCVPYDASWKEALALTENDGNLYGRGACDTKAYVACALTAAERTRNAKPLMLLFTADEEQGCLGAKKLLDAGLGKARFAIVGEPTSLTPIRANKGYCLAEIEIGGKEGHSAYPDVGASAIFRAARFLKRLEEFSVTLRQDGDELFDPPFTSINVGVISGGKAKNVIPGSCRFIVEWRPIPSQPIERVGQMLEQIRRELTRDDPTFEARITVLRSDRGVVTSERSRIVRFIVDETGKQPQTVAFGTEAPQLTALGAEAVVFGPGDIRVAHRTGEFVPIAELIRCEQILEKAIAVFCAE